MNKNILVFVEQRSGSILPASFQLLAVANHLASATGGQAEACVVGEGVGSLTDKIAAQGAKKIYTVDGPEFGMYRPGAYTTALSAVIETKTSRLPDQDAESTRLSTARRWSALSPYRPSASAAAIRT